MENLDYEAIEMLRIEIGRSHCRPNSPQARGTAMIAFLFLIGLIASIPLLIIGGSIALMGFGS